MNWQDEYRRKLVDIDAAVQRIETGNDVIVAQCASEPQGCMSRFHIVADRVEDVRVFSVLTLKPYDFYMKPEMKGHFELASWFHAPGSREALKAGTGTVTYVPNMLHRAAADRIHAHTPDIFFGTCTPPDAHGFVSLSLGITYEKDVLEAARTRRPGGQPPPARAPSATPKCTSPTWTCFVEHDQEVPDAALPLALARPTSRSAGTSPSWWRTAARSSWASAASPTPRPWPCADKHDLGVHTEMIVDSMMELYEMGVVTNERKGLMKGKFVCTFAMGSRRLYDWLRRQRGRAVRAGQVGQRPGRDPAELEDGLHQHLPHGRPHRPGGKRVDRHHPVLGNRRPVRHGHRRRGGASTGRARASSPATARPRAGSVSTIVPVLPEGTAVTLHRSNTDHVVTEHGIARLRGRTTRERARALIAVAHPDFRSELTARAKTLGYI